MQTTIGVIGALRVNLALPLTSCGLYGCKGYGSAVYGGKISLQNINEISLIQIS